MSEWGCYSLEGISIEFLMTICSLAREMRDLDMRHLSFVNKVGDREVVGWLGNAGNIDVVGVVARDEGAREVGAVAALETLNMPIRKGKMFGRVERWSDTNSMNPNRTVTYNLRTTVAPCKGRVDEVF